MLLAKYLNSLNIEIDLANGSAAYVVIDSIIDNTSSGGVRILDDISREEVRTLAREMTLKYSFIGLPRGGAKSGIQIPMDTAKEEKIRILEEFGRRLSPIIRAGIYYPGMDMNCGSDELRAIYRGAGLTLGEITDTSYFTAISVANAIYACRDFYFDDTTPHPSPLPQGERGKRTISIAIEGFGSVGSYLAERLPEDDYRIVAISTIKGGIINNRGFSVETLLKYRKEFGDNLVNKIRDGKAIQKEDVLTADVDILIPSARTWVIDAGIAKDIKARFIVPVANAPYTEDAIDVLHEKGIICLPGFVTNSGGVYASSLFDSGVPISQIENISNTRYRNIVRTLLEKSMELRESPIEVAKKIAYKRLEARINSPGSGLCKRLIKKTFQKGIIPKKIYGRIILQEFVENLDKLNSQILSS